MTPERLVSREDFEVFLGRLVASRRAAASKEGDAPSTGASPNHTEEHTWLRWNIDDWAARD